MDLHHVTSVVAAPDTAWRPGDAYLAGGSWLFSEPQPSVSRLVDLAAFGWPSLTVSDEGLEIAATCTLAELAAWTPPPEWPAGALARQCCDALLGSFKVWNTATVGGNICLALPAGPMTSFTAALDGVATIWAPDGTARTAAIGDVVVAPRTTSLAPGELLRSVTIPASALRSRTAFRQFSLAPYGRSAALVIGRRDGDEVVLTITASTPAPVRLRLPLGGNAVAAIRTVERWYDDVHGDPQWRAAVTARFAAEVTAELSDA